MRLQKVEAINLGNMRNDFTICHDEQPAAVRVSIAIAGRNVGKLNPYPCSSRGSRMFAYGNSNFEGFA